jgi:hypothetical protein
MGKKDDDTPDIDTMIREIAAADPQLVFNMARERMKQILGTDLELWDAGDTFNVTWTEKGVAIWASAGAVIKLLREVHDRGCEGFYHIALLEDRDAPDPSKPLILFEDRTTAK